MSLIPRIEANTSTTSGGPSLAAPAAPVAAAQSAATAPAQYDGSPPLTAWTWSWAKTGGSLTDLADALARAQDLRVSRVLDPAAHADVDAQRALALLSA